MSFKTTLHESPKRIARHPKRNRVEHEIVMRILRHIVGLEIADDLSAETSPNCSPDALISLAADRAD